MQPLTLEALYSQYGAMVLRRAQALLGDRDSALDVTQEVFLTVLRSSAAFRGQSSPITWLYRITTNLCFNRVRDGGRRAALLEKRYAPALQSATHAPPSEERLMLQQVLRHLPAELAEVAVYYYVDQMSHEEIAGLLGVSRRTVGNRLESFLSHARQLIADSQGESAA